MQKYPLRVLRIVPSLEMGGVENTLLSLLPRLNKDKYRVSVCCLYRADDLAKEAEKQKIPLLTLKMRPRLDLDLKYLRGISQLIKFLKQEKIDIVHTHLYKANTPGRIAAILARVPIIIANEHSVDFWKTGGQRAIDKFLSKFTDKIIVVSEAVKEFCTQEVGLPKDKVTVLYNGVDLQKFLPEVDINKKKEELNLPSDSKVVGIIGRLQQIKGHQFFLKAAKIVSGEFPSACFLVIGEGSLRDELEEMADKLNLGDKVIFTGQRDDVPQILPLLDVSVLSSLREGFSITILESMASGIPVVATDVGGNRELVEEGKTGHLVPARDTESLAGAMIRILKDESLAKRMVERARERVKLFSINRMAKETESIYDELIRQARLVQDSE